MTDLGGWVIRWSEFLLHQRRLSPHTLIAYKGDLEQFLTFCTEHLGKIATLQDLESLSLKDFRAWLASRYGVFHVRSNARALASLKNFWRFLLKHEVLSSEVIFFLTSPRIKKTLPRPLNHEQATFLKDNIENEAREPWVGLRDRALVILLYGTGMRISEALSLRYEDPSKDFVTIKGKGGKERQIPLLEEVKDVLFTYKESCPYGKMGSALFFQLRGGDLDSTTANKVIRTFRRLYNLPETLTPHALRHTCASHLMNASGDLRGIQTLLGHASLSSTQVYTDLDTQKLLNIYKEAHPRMNIKEKQGTS